MGMRRLRLDEIEASPYPVEPVVHSIEAQAHLRHLTRYVREAALDRAEPAPLLTLLFADVAQLIPDRAEVFQSHVWRLFTHERFLGPKLSRCKLVGGNWRGFALTKSTNNGGHGETFEQLKVRDPSRVYRDSMTRA
jgi:hypothetical protein